MISIIKEKDLVLETNNIIDLYKWIIKNKDDEFDKVSVVGDQQGIDLFEFFKFYLDVKEDCEERIKDINDNFVDFTDNKLVIDATKELVRMNSDGKFIRACLIALGYYSKGEKGLSKEEYLPLAAAYETFQTSILIHDDIIDNADLRRGKITIPKSYSNSFEKECNNTGDFKQKKNHISNSLGICIGDLGFYLASKIVIDNYRKNENFDRILNLYNKIVINTIKGEIIDVLLPFNQQYIPTTSTTEDDIMEIYRLKTAWYSIIGPFSLGMVLSDYTDEEIEKMQHILYSLGIGFQIKDDILGVFGKEDEIGKSATSDISEFKQTILYSYISENHPEQLKELHKYYGKENLTNLDIEKVKDIFTNTGAKEYATDMMNKMFEDAKRELSDIDFLTTKYKQILYGFITYLDLRTK